MGAPAELFSLIEQFLQDQGCVNTLKAFKKEAKNTLKSSTKPKKTLIEIYEGQATDTSSNSSSSSESSDSSDSSDSDSEDEKMEEVKAESSSDSSSSEAESKSSSSSSSSSSESEDDADAESSDSSDEEGSSSSSSSEDDSDDEDTTTVESDIIAAVTQGSDSDSDSSSSSSSSSSGSGSSSDSSSSSSSSDSDSSDSEDEKVTVKKAVVEETIITPPAKKQKIEGPKTPKVQNEPFKRVKAEDVVFLNDKLKDNTYMSKGGSEAGYGYRAHLDMIVTKGKGFRAEKTKKKRGSYKGGVIDFASHSFKFPDSE